MTKKDYNIKDLFEDIEIVLDMPIPVGDEAVEKIRHAYFRDSCSAKSKLDDLFDTEAGEKYDDPTVRRSLNFRRTIERLTTDEVNIDYKRFCLMAEIFVREALEKEAEGDLDAYDAYMERASLIFKGDSRAQEKFEQLMTGDGYSGEFNIKTIYTNGGTTEGSSHYKKARAIYEFAKNSSFTSSISTKILKDPTPAEKELRWTEKEIEESNDYHELLYYFMSRFVSFMGGMIDVRNPRDEEEKLYNKITQKLKKSEYHYRDPLGIGIIGKKEHDLDALRNSITLNPKNIQRQKDLSAVHLERSMTNTDAIEDFIAVDLLHDEILGLYEGRIAEQEKSQSGRSSQNLRTLQVELEMFHMTFGQGCYDQLKRFAEKMYGNKVSKVPKRISNFYWPHVFEIIIENAIKSTEIATKKTDSAGHEPTMLLSELYCAVGYFEGALTLWQGDPRRQKSIKTQARNRVKILGLYQNILHELADLENAKAEQSFLEKRIINCNDGGKRKGFQKQLAQRNRECVTKYKNMVSSFKKLASIIDKQPSLSQIKYRKELFAIVAAVEQSTEEYWYNLSCLLEKRSNDDKAIEHLIEEAYQWIDVNYRNLGPNFTREEVKAVVSSASSWGMTRLYKYYEGLFKGFKEEAEKLFTNSDKLGFNLDLVEKAALVNRFSSLIEEAQRERGSLHASIETAVERVFGEKKPDHEFAQYWIIFNFIIDTKDLRYFPGKTSSFKNNQFIDYANKIDQAQWEIQQEEKEKEARMKELKAKETEARKRQVDAQNAPEKPDFEASARAKLDDLFAADPPEDKKDGTEIIEVPEVEGEFVIEIPIEEEVEEGPEIVDDGILAEASDPEPEGLLEGWGASVSEETSEEPEEGFLPFFSEAEEEGDGEEPGTGLSPERIEEAAQKALRLPDEDKKEVTGEIVEEIQEEGDTGEEQGTEEKPEGTPDDDKVIEEDGSTSSSSDLMSGWGPIVEEEKEENSEEGEEEEE